MSIQAVDARDDVRGTVGSDAPTGPPPDRATAGPGVAVPPWFLLPGLGLLAASLYGYHQYQRTFPAGGFDLGIYRQAVAAYLTGRDVYALAFTHGLPYTYPPVTLPLLAPLARFDDAGALTVLTAVSVAAMVLAVWSCTGLLGYRGAAGRLGVAGGVVGLGVWFEPFTSTIDLGQVNAVLVVLVVADLALPDRHRLRGVGVGVAAACKLVPGIFVVYLLLTRRPRAAAVAGGTFLAMGLVGGLLAPRLSAAYWLDGLFLQSSRVTASTGPAFVGNQSLRGAVVRTWGETTGAAVAWTVGAVVVGVAGLALAVTAHRRGEEAVALVAVAFTAVLVCPVSWSHHWLWVVVLLPVLLDVVRRLHGAAQVLAAGLLPLWTAVLLVWPLRGRPGEPLSAGGLIWVAYRHDPLVRWLGQNLYVLAVLATMLLAGWWLRAVRPGFPESPTRSALLS